MSDFYSKIAEQNPEIKAALSEEAARQDIIFSIDKLNILTAAVVSTCVGRSFKTAVNTFGMSRAAQVGIDFDINLHYAGGTVVATAVIENQFTADQVIKAIVSSLGSTIADTAIAGLGLSLAPEILMVAGASFAISELVDDGVDGFMDMKAIAEAEANGSRSIFCANELNEFISERWEHVVDFPDWSLQKQGDDSGLKLTFYKNNGENVPNWLGTNQRSYLPNENPELFETICRKIGTNFNLKIQDEPVDLIHNYFGMGLSELVNAAETKEGLFAMQHLAPFVATNKAETEYQNIAPASYSDGYKTDRARFLYLQNKSR